MRLSLNGDQRLRVSTTRPPKNIIVLYAYWISHTYRNKPALHSHRERLRTKECEFSSIFASRELFCNLPWKFSQECSTCFIFLKSSIFYENGNIIAFVIYHRQSTNEMKMSVAKDTFYFTLWLCKNRGMRCEAFSRFYIILCALDLQKWLSRSPYRWVRNQLSTPVIRGFSIRVLFEIFITILFLQVIVWDCLNNYEYDNAIFLAERLHAEGNFFIFLFVKSGRVTLV